MVEVGLSVIHESLSTQTSLKSASAHTVDYHMYMLSTIISAHLLTRLQANTHHRKYLESLPSTSYPLKSTGDPAEVRIPQTPTILGEIQGHAPKLMGEHIAESEDGQPFQQR